MIGQTISHYKITAKLGEGGMGVVYKAEDAKLERSVALKFLASHLVSDAEVRKRFEREARAAASLNHPNICTIHEIDQHDGQPFIAMEFVDGETVAATVEKGPLKIDKALDIAIQAAHGLAVAHGRGIVHRDIKSANIMLASERTGQERQVKLMDFGLAQLTTARTQLTKEGSTLGTLAYMAPEQARGEKVDQRADVWALGVVLYEMVAGRQPFDAEYEQAILYSILNEAHEPLSALRTGAPKELERIVDKCLAKDADERYPHIADLLVDLRACRRSLERQTATMARKPALLSRTPLFVGAAALILACAVLYWWLTRVPQFPPETTALNAPLVPTPLTSYQGLERHPTFSPDGNEVAFAWNGGDGDNSSIYRKLIGPGGPLRITTNPAKEYSPAWSPDGSYIAFLRDMGNNKVGVFIIPSLGGPERPLMDKRTTAYGIDRLAWSPDSKWLVFSDQAMDDYRYGLFLLSVATGETRQITFPPETSRVGDHNASFSPDGHRLLFIRTEGFQGAVYLLRLSEDYTPEGEPERLTSHYKPTKSAFWTQGGREIIFAAPEGLWRVPVSSPEAAKPLASIAGGADDLVVSANGDRFVFSQPSSDQDILLVEIPGPDGSQTPSKPFASSTRPDFEPRWSPEGSRVAFTSIRTGNREIWICDRDGSNEIQVTTAHGRHVGWPNWSPDGKFLAFDGEGEGSRDIYIVNANGGEPRLLTTDPADDAVPSWSQDGKWIYFASQRTGDSQVWKIPVDGGKAVQITTTGGRWPYESPDGQYVYFAKSTGDFGLWRLPLAGGEDELVLNNVNGNMFTLAKRGIYFVTQEEGRRTINFLSFASRETKWVTDVESDFVMPNVSPDEKWILGVVREEMGSDLMLVGNFK